MYGFKEKDQRESYSARLAEVMPMFPGFRAEYFGIMSDLKLIAMCDSWWKDVRNIEVHIDVNELYKYRNEIVNESKVAMEAYRLIDFFNRLNSLMARINRACINFMIRHLKVE